MRARGIGGFAEGCDGDDAVAVARDDADGQSVDGDLGARVDVGGVEEEDAVAGDNGGLEELG